MRSRHGDRLALDVAIMRTHLGSHAPELLAHYDALVEIARAAREAVDNVRVVLPSVGSDQHTVMALVEEWQDAVVSVADLDAALARLDSGAAEENT